MHFYKRGGVPIGMGGLDVVSAYTHPSAPSGHLESGAIATSDWVWNRFATLEREALAGGRLPPLRRVMQVQWCELVPTRAADCRPYAV